MDAAARILNADITILGGSSISEPNSDGLAEDVELVISPITSDQQIDFPRGEAPKTAQAQIIMDGDIELWPFDRYLAEALSVEAFSIDNGNRRAIPAAVAIGGRLQGWKFAATSLLPGAVEGDVGTQFYALKASRSGGTLTFAVVMMGVLILMPVLSVFVAAQTYRGNRMVEPAFTGWITAMLFATFSLRAFLPGAPPVGSWVDAVVVLWVAVALVGSLAVYVVAWWQSTHESQQQS